MEGVTEITECTSEAVDVPSPFDLLEPPTSGGFLKLSKPCCYIFPGGRGDSALFAVNGFNILINGGSNRRSCFWKLVRHLDRIDCLLLTHTGADNLPGINGLLQRKVAEQHEGQSQGSMTYSDRMKNLVSPELGVVFFNVPEKLHTSECNLKVKRSIEEASLTLQYLSKLGIKPEPLFRVVSNTIEPITLFHKLGVGRLDMFVLNPVQDSKEMQFLMQKCAGNSKAKTGIVLANGKEGEISVPYLTSITALVVWLPASPTENIVRVLFPGNAPQNKIFEGLEKLKHLDFLRYPVATQKNMTGLPPTAAKQTQIKQRTDSKQILKSSPKTHTETKPSKKETTENENVSIISKSDSVKENKIKEKKQKPLRTKAEVAGKKKFLKEKTLRKHTKERVSKMDEKKDKEKRDIKKEKYAVKKDDGGKKDEKRVKDTLKPQLRKILKPELKPFTPEVRKTLKAKTQGKPKTMKSKPAPAKSAEEVIHGAQEKETKETTSTPEDLTIGFDHLRSTEAPNTVLTISKPAATENAEHLITAETEKEQDCVIKTASTTTEQKLTEKMVMPSAEITETVPLEEVNKSQVSELEKFEDESAAIEDEDEEEAAKEYNDLKEVDRKHEVEEMEKQRLRKETKTAEEMFEDKDVIEKAEPEEAEDLDATADEEIKNQKSKKKVKDFEIIEEENAYVSNVGGITGSITSTAQEATAVENLSHIQDETMTGFSEAEQTIDSQATEDKKAGKSSGTPFSSDTCMRIKEIVAHLELPKDSGETSPKPKKECVVETVSPSSKSVTEISSPPLSDSKALGFRLSSADKHDKHESLLSSTSDFTCNENRIQSQITKSKGIKDKNKFDSDKSIEGPFYSNLYSPVEKNKDTRSVQSDTPHSNDDKHEFEPQTISGIKCEGSESLISAQAAVFDATYSSSSSSISYSSSTSASYSTGQHYGERPDTPLTFPSTQLKSDGDSEFSSLKEEEESPMLDLPYLSSGEHLNDEYMDVSDRNVLAAAESVSCLARFSPLSPLEECKSSSQGRTSSAEETSEEEMSSITSDKHLSHPKRGPTTEPPHSAASNTEMTSDIFHMCNITPSHLQKESNKPSEEKSSNEEPENNDSHFEEGTSVCRIEFYSSSAPDEKTSKVSLTEQHTDEDKKEESGYREDVYEVMKEEEEKVIAAEAKLDSDLENVEYLPVESSRDPPPMTMKDPLPHSPHPGVCMVDPEALLGGQIHTEPPAKKDLNTNRSLRKTLVKSNAGSDQKSRSWQPIYVDLAYIPNPCIAKNVDEEFFKSVRAAYYATSGDGLAGAEPSPAVLEALLEGKAQWGTNLQVTLIATRDTEETWDWYQQTPEKQQDLNIKVLASSSTAVMQEESFPACKIQF